LNYCEELHKIFNKMKRYTAKTIDEIPFNNGIYIVFDENEKYGNYDRIIRVGTSTGQDQLRSRLKQHFLNENKDRSIFRKNIGRAMLNIINNSLLEYWNLDLTKSNDKNKYFNKEKTDQCKSIEHDITDYLAENMSFVVFNVETKELRLRFEKAIISTLYNSVNFVASNDWLGNFVPKIRGNHVKDSRMWVSQGIKAKPLTFGELEQIRGICGV